MFASPTVVGVPLEPGERVVYFYRDDPGWQKPVLIVLGILTLVGVIGIVFLLIGLTTSTQYAVITNRRFLIVSKQRVEQLRLERVTNITKKIKGRELRWIDVQGPSGTRSLDFQVAAFPGIVPYFQHFAANPRAFEMLPGVPYEAVVGDKPKPLTAGAPM